VRSRLGLKSCSYAKRADRPQPGHRRQSDLVTAHAISTLEDLLSNIVGSCVAACWAMAIGELRVSVRGQTRKASIPDRSSLTFPGQRQAPGVRSEEIGSTRSSQTCRRARHWRRSVIGVPSDLSVSLTSRERLTAADQIPAIRPATSSLKQWADGLFLHHRLSGPSFP